MKKIMSICLGILFMTMSLRVGATGVETFPDKISFLTLKAYNVENENEMLPNVLVEIFTEEGESLGVYETNKNGELFIEIIPGFYRIEIIESAEGFEALSESKTQIIDASDIDVYEISLLHAPIESVSTRVIPKTGFEQFMIPLALGCTLIAGGMYLTKRQK